MKTFFVEQTKSENLIKAIFNKVTKENNKIIINVNISKAKFDKKVKVARKIISILSSEKSRQIVVEKKLKEDKELMNILYGSNINICEPNWVFKQLTNEVIEDILKDTKKEECELWVCVNDVDILSEKYIYKFAKEFKRLNIITNHIGKFKKIEKKLFEQDGILITVTNNKRKSLSKAEIILNIDFPKELLNRFVVYNKANIITWEDEIKFNKKRFNGKIISSIDNETIEYDENILKFITENKLERYDIRDVCQAIENVPILKNN